MFTRNLQFFFQTSALKTALNFFQYSNEENIKEQNIGSQVPSQTRFQSKISCGKISGKRISINFLIPWPMFRLKYKTSLNANLRFPVRIHALYVVLRRSLRP